MRLQHSRDMFMYVHFEGMYIVAVFDAPKMLTPWKKGYDQPRQHIKKQRHYFADKCPSRPSHGFSSSHVWM